MAGHTHPESDAPLQLHSPTLPSSVARSQQTKDALARIPTSPQMGHRQSFGENLRGVPSSPRLRHPSLGQQAFQDLINDPPVKGGETKFRGRDWHTLKLGEIVSEEQLKFIDVDATVEEATNLLITSTPNVVLIRETTASHTVIGTFDYADLNAYLLLVVGLAQPEDGQAESFKEIAEKGREGKPIPLKDVKDIGRKEPNVFLSDKEDLTRAMEVFGSGIHRILITREGSQEVTGILTQLRLLRFFWENRNSFPALEPLYSSILKDAGLGSHKVVSINGDKPLTAALELMNNEGVTSLPVLDNQRNVVGNISNVDVRLLTKSTSLPLLSSSCIHFISVILSERGVIDGKDSFPVFHVNPYSTLAHTVAKLVATRSHRMWVVDAPSPASSTPSTPAPASAVLVPPMISNQATSTMTLHGNTSAPAPAVSASGLPGANLSGRLSGVVSLTDILNLFARKSGLHPHNPDETRRHRRRSSSSSVRKSVDSLRSDISGLDGSGVTSGLGVGRSSSVAGKRS